MRSRLPNSPLLRSVIAGFAGLVGYGSWAAYANFDHGMAIAVRSGLVQGTYSFVLTFLMTWVTEGLFAKLASMPMGAVVTTVVVSFILFVSAYGIHMLVGTPEILMTILPGFVIGSGYTAVYVWGLQRGTKTVAQGQ